MKRNAFSDNCDPWLAKSWHLPAIGTFDVWSKYTLGDPRAVIAFVDSGIDYKTPDLVNKLWVNTKETPKDGIDNDNNGFIDDIIGWNYVNGKWGKGTNNPMDYSGHGTFIAGIAAAELNNGIGGVGVCPKCSVMGVRFLNYEGLGETEDAILGIYFAIKHNVRVLNLSFAGEGYDADLDKAIRAAGDHNIVVIAAAGNDGSNNDHESVYPANLRYPFMLTVAAVDPEGKLWENSDYGKKNVDIAAPGTDIPGPWLKGEWDTGNGTSLAAPIVSAVAGLVISANPKLNASQVVYIIKKTASKSVHLKGKLVTEGIVNAEAAVRCAVTGDCI